MIYALYFMVYWLLCIGVWFAVLWPGYHKALKAVDPLEREDYYAYLIKCGASNDLVEDERQYADRVRNQIITTCVLDILAAPIAIPAAFVTYAARKLFDRPAA